MEAFIDSYISTAVYDSADHDHIPFSLVHSGSIDDASREKMRQDCVRFLRIHPALNTSEGGVDFWHTRNDPRWEFSPCDHEYVTPGQAARATATARKFGPCSLIQSGDNISIDPRY